MELPVVNHPDYVAKINEDNKFPIQKFGALAEHLIKESVVKKFYIPQECSTETMKTSHSDVLAFLAGNMSRFAWRIRCSGRNRANPSVESCFQNCTDEKNILFIVVCFLTR